jgi:uncharacterized protein (TIGR02147 family)
MSEQIHLQNTLNRKFLEIKSRNSGFSLRAFAKKLGIQSSPLSEILRGKRKVSRSMAEKFAMKLMLDPTESMYLLKDFPAATKRNAAAKEKNLQDLEVMRLNAEKFTLIADWVHYAILNLTTTQDFISDPEWMAERLGVKREKIEQCLVRLLDLNLITRDDRGEFTRLYTSVKSPDDVATVSIKKSHLEDLEMAKEKLIECDVKQRDFTSITIPFDEELMPEVKVLIRRFQNGIYDLMRNYEPREVYKMNTYLYPLTKREKEKK